MNPVNTFEECGAVVSSHLVADRQRRVSSGWGLGLGGSVGLLGSVLMQSRDATYHADQGQFLGFVIGPASESSSGPPGSPNGAQDDIGAARRGQPRQPRPAPAARPRQRAGARPAARPRYPARAARDCRARTAGG